MVHKDSDSRMLDKVIFMKVLCPEGKVISKEWLTPRKAYRNSFGEYIIVTRNNRDYRAYIKPDRVKGVRCYSVSVWVEKGCTHSLLKRTSVAVHKDVFENIKEVAKKDGITVAQAIREVIEWGLEQASKDERYDFKEPSF